VNQVNAARLRDARQDVVEVFRRVHARGWIAATDGNASVLIDDHIVATPTGIHKGYMQPNDLIIVDRHGRVVEGERRPSSEIEMHLAVYEQRPDVRAVLHAHPTHCIALSLAGVRLDACLLPEVVLTFGSIPTVPYTTPTIQEVPDEVRRWVRDYDALLLERHGSLTMGADIFDAYNKLERMEHVAEIVFRARLMGPVQSLTCEQISKLQHVVRALGLPDRPLLDSPCSRGNNESSGQDIDALVHRVKAQLSRI